MYLPKRYSRSPYKYNKIIKNSIFLLSLDSIDLSGAHTHKIQVLPFLTAPSPLTGLGKKPEFTVQVASGDADGRLFWKRARIGEHVPAGEHSDTETFMVSRQVKHERRKELRPSSHARSLQARGATLAAGNHLQRGSFTDQKPNTPCQMEKGTSQLLLFFSPQRAQAQAGCRWKRRQALQGSRVTDFFRISGLGRLALGWPQRRSRPHQPAVEDSKPQWNLSPS